MARMEETAGPPCYTHTVVLAGQCWVLCDHTPLGTCQHTARQARLPSRQAKLPSRWAELPNRQNMLQRLPNIEKDELPNSDIMLTSGEAMLSNSEDMLSSNQARLPKSKLILSNNETTLLTKSVPKSEAKSVVKLPRTSTRLSHSEAALVAPRLPSTKLEEGTGGEREKEQDQDATSGSGDGSFGDDLSFFLRWNIS